MTNTLERALRRLSHPILELILVRRRYAFEKVPCKPGAGSLNKFGSAYIRKNGKGILQVNGFRGDQRFDFERLR
jgi:hypothetical protein